MKSSKGRTFKDGGVYLNAAIRGGGGLGNADGE